MNTFLFTDLAGIPDHFLRFGRDTPDFRSLQVYQTVQTLSYKIRTQAEMAFETPKTTASSKETTVTLLSSTQAKIPQVRKITIPNRKKSPGITMTNSFLKMGKKFSNQKKINETPSHFYEDPGSHSAQANSLTSSFFTPKF